MRGGFSAEGWLGLRTLLPSVEGWLGLRTLLLGVAGWLVSQVCRLLFVLPVALAG